MNYSQKLLKIYDLFQKIKKTTSFEVVLIGGEYRIRIPLFQLLRSQKERGLSPVLAFTKGCTGGADGLNLLK